MSAIINEGLVKQLVQRFYMKRRAGEKISVILHELLHETYAQGVAAASRAAAAADAARLAQRVASPLSRPCSAVLTPLEQWEARQLLTFHPAPSSDAAAVDEADLECQVPPFGWRCTRGAGHSGPCAAVECPEDVAAVEQGMERLAAHPANGAEECSIPPPGWYCTRQPGHVGPCAAHPEPFTARAGDEWLGAAARDVLAERCRQIDMEGYDTAHDDEHVNDEIAAYATFYAMPPGARDWPAEETGYGATWGEAIIPENWGPAKPGNRRGELVKAGALIVAEIERLDRAAAPKKKQG